VTTVSEAFVTLRPDTSGFGRETEGGIRRALSGVAKIAGGIVAANVLQNAAQGVKDFVGGSVEQASALGESINAVQQIFAETAPQILDWGKANATSFGLSQRAFNEMATPMGAVLKNLGLDQDAVADSTVDLTKRAADMASVFNTDVEDALAAINSALRGEANPIERYGVSVTAAAVAQRALADTGKTSAEALTETEKASARLAIIFEQTEAVAGDFQNTSDGLANSQRVQAAETERYQAMIGAKLIPVQLAWNRAKFATVRLIAERMIPALTTLSAWISDRVIPVLHDLAARFREEVLPVLRDDVMPVVERFTRDVLGALVTTFQDDVQPKLEAFVGALRDHILPAVVALGEFVRDQLFPPMKAFVDFLANHKEFIAGFGVAIAVVVAPAFVAWAVAAGAAAVATIAATAPAVALTVAIAALAGGIIWAVRHWDEVTEAMGRFADFVTDKLTDLVGWLRDRFFAFLDSKFAWFAALLLGPAGVLVVVYQFRDEIAGAFDWIAEKVAAFVGDVLGALRDAWTRARDGARTAWSGIVRVVEGFLRDAVRVVTGFASDVYNGAKSFGMAIINGIVDGIRSIGGAIGGAIADQIPDSLPLPGGFSVPLDPRQWSLPGFDTGGIVPGPLGAPVPILAHGGETVLPTHKNLGFGGPTVQFLGPVTIEATSRMAAERAAGDIGWGLQQAMRGRGLA
jgi:hypothetical protein